MISSILKILGVKRYERCWGISSPAFGRWKLEIWFAPSGYEIRPHTHANEDIKLIFLLGNNISFYRRKPSNWLPDFFYAKWYHFGRKFNIKAGDEHYFKVSSWPLVFLNIEHWKIKPTSASEDFQLTN